MKKIFLLLVTLVIYVNVMAKDNNDIEKYIKDIDAKIEAEFHKNPREKYPKPLSEEELRSVPLAFQGYVEQVKENGYLNIYSGYTQGLLQSYVLGEDGEPYGVYKFFYDDGKLKEIGFIDKGNRNSGTKRIYYPNGKLEMLVPYYKGVIEGDRILYYENGKMKEKYRYINGKEQGEGVVYYENGSPMVIETYKDGKQEGPYRLYAPNGQLMETGVNKDGKTIPDKK